jgi:hypothetical protein
VSYGKFSIGVVFLLFSAAQSRAQWGLDPLAGTSRSNMSGEGCQEIRIRVEDKPYAISMLNRLDR